MKPKTIEVELNIKEDGKEPILYTIRTSKTKKNDGFFISDYLLCVIKDLLEEAFAGTTESEIRIKVIKKYMKKDPEKMFEILKGIRNCPATRYKWAKRVKRWKK